MVHRQAVDIIKAMRPRQWVKNIAVLVTLVFSRNLLNPHKLVLALAAFVLFCGLSGAVYISNDLIDREQDRSHPVKKNRPITSGAVPASTATLVSSALILVCVALSFLIHVQLGCTVLLYAMLQVAYSLRLKHLVIIDIFCIAAGFFLRVIGGAFAIDVMVSSWLLVCTFFLSLFLALSKRRHELVILEQAAGDHRKVLQKYDILLLDQMISVVTSASIVAYSLYTLAPETVARFGTTRLIYTIPFVLYGIYRYLYLVYRKNLGGQPEEILLTDRPLIINILLYVIVTGSIIYAQTLLKLLQRVM